MQRVGVACSCRDQQKEYNTHRTESSVFVCVCVIGLITRNCYYTEAVATAGGECVNYRRATTFNTYNYARPCEPHGCGCRLLCFPQYLYNTMRIDFRESLALCASSPAQSNGDAHRPFKLVFPINTHISDLSKLMIHARFRHCTCIAL